VNSYARRTVRSVCYWLFRGFNASKNAFLSPFEGQLLEAKSIQSSPFPGYGGYHTIVSNVIYMEERTSVSPWRSIAVRDRRYSIRYPFAADAELLDLETGAETSGVTCDISIGGTFVCSSKPLNQGCRVRLRLTRKDQIVDVLAVVRIVKSRIGMGIEFLDVESPSDQTLFRWIEQLRRK